MNTTDKQHIDPRRDPQRLVPTPADEALSVPREHRYPAVEASATPEAVRAAQVARTEKQHAAATVRGRGVEWVRPTDLMARHSANVAGRGLDFQAELARRTRTPLRIGMQAARDRARRLPPITAFGRRTVTTAAPTRPGVGMG